MNKLRFLCLFILVSSTAFAQRQNLYFLKNTGERVKMVDSADYLRIVKEPEESSNLYVVNEYYRDGTIKTLGYSSKIDPPVYEGQYVSYYKNGKKSMVAQYKKGKLIDTSFHYYPNGKLYTVVGNSTTSDGKLLKYIKSVIDSTGNDLVVDGEGECVFYDSKFKAIAERGRIKNGKYDGEWVGGSSANEPSYKEMYKDGELLSGESYDKEGNTYQYTKVSILPQFKGGVNNFYNYLKRTIRYPADAQRNRIQGVVKLKFTITKDGSVQNIKVMNEIHPSLETEALRVIKNSPKWEPGIRRGKVVDAVYNVPVSFKLN